MRSMVSLVADPYPLLSNSLQNQIPDLDEDGEGSWCREQVGGLAYSSFLLMIHLACNYTTCAISSGILAMTVQWKLLA